MGTLEDKADLFYLDLNLTVFTKICSIVQKLCFISLFESLMKMGARIEYLQNKDK